MSTQEQGSSGLSATSAFDALASAFKLPFSSSKFIEKVTTGTVNEAGKRTLQVLLTTWDATGGGPFAASAIGTLGVNKAVDMLMGQFTGPLFDRLLRALGVDQPRHRAALCASQIVGLGLMRYVAKTEPLASEDVDTVVDMVAPTLQRYLTGDLTKAS